MVWNRIKPTISRSEAMSSQAQFEQWQFTIMQHLPHLSKPQAYGLALWSWGMVLARSCALTAVSGLLAAVWRRKENTLRQRLREWYYEAAAKRGQQRQTLEVESCFAPLLRWVITEWRGTQIALALDASSLGMRFVVLARSVVYRGCAIPVAWIVLPAAKRRAWRPEWLRLLRRLHRVIPNDWTVIVLADRGLYARWLYRRIVRLGWHPFLRINTGGTFRPEGQRRAEPLKTLVPEPGTSWAGRGTAFSGPSRRLACTLLARWDEGDKDPWLMVTALAPEASEAAWYGLRAWIEQSFKVAKRGGWQWQRTRMMDAERATRLWLAIAVATLWLLRVGGEADATMPDSTLLDVTGLCPHQPRAPRTRRWRLVSVFRRGWNLIMAALLCQEPLPQGRFIPEAWPTAREPDAETSLPLPQAA
jgi:Transposase DDE domain